MTYTRTLFLLVALGSSGALLAISVCGQETDDQCCVPAHEAVPVKPPGADDSCHCYEAKTCDHYSHGGKCSGRSANAEEGCCAPQAGSECEEDVVATYVTARYGHWKCHGGVACDGNDDCECEWIWETETEDIEVDNCDGDPCASPDAEC